MNRIFFTFLLAVSVCNLLAQKTIRDANAEKRNVIGYHAVSVSSGIDLYLSQGDESVAVSASQTRYRDRIRTEVKDGVLKIWYDHNRVDIQFNDRKMRAYVSFKTLDMLVARGGSDILVDGSIKVGTLSLDISGGSDFKGKIHADDLKVNASGGSDVDISGAVKNLEINASGGSDFKGYQLSSDVCNVGVSAGSDAFITVNNELSAQASGGSDIFYKGNCVIRGIKTSGSSDIKKVKS